MTQLDYNWLTEGIFDFEYKKYVLLAYLQHIEGQFTKDKYFPHLNELRLHFDTCVGLQHKKQAIKKSFPKNLKGINLKAVKLEYEETISDDPYLSELTGILDFAIPLFSGTLDKGASRISEIGEHITISPVGIVPLRTEEGYLIFLHSYEKMVSIFQYQLALYNEYRERYLRTVFIDRVRIGIGTTISQVKVDLTRKYQLMPNPATYVVESKYDYPLQETLLPVTKKLMLRHLNVA